MKRHLLLAAAIFLAIAGPAYAVNFTTSGYSQDFNSMGTSGTAAPTGWSVWTASGGHDSWSSSNGYVITANGSAPSVSAMTAASATLKAQTDTSISAISANKGAVGFNLAHSTTTSDRVLGTSPSGNAGTGLQLSLTNTTGAAISALSLSYDLVKFSDGQYSNTSYSPAQEELPGYQLFYQLGSGSWTNVSLLNPVRTADGVHPVVAVGTPGTLDYATTAISNAQISLATAWGSGQTLNFRWVDDNSQPLSADQVIGLNNVSVKAAVPIPGAVWLLGSGLAGLVGLRRKIAA